MLEIRLISMPCAEIDWASLALAQLEQALLDRFQSSIHVEVFYLNHDFVALLGMEAYHDLLSWGGKSSSGLELDNISLSVKEWIFRRAAFPQAVENGKEFLQGYLHMSDNMYQRILDIESRVPSILSIILNQYHLSQVNVVCFTSMFDQNLASLAMARLIKQINASVVTIMGGPNCNYPAGAEMSENVPYLDWAISGCGLTALPKLIECLLMDKHQLADQIPGVFSFRNREKMERDGTLLGESSGVYSHIHLNYDHFFSSLTSKLPDIKHMPILFFETSRGCWWGERSRCTFCDVNQWEKKYQTLEPRKAIAMLRELFHYKDICKMFWAVDSVFPLSYLDSVFPILTQEMQNCNVFYEIRVDMTPYDLKRMWKYNIRYIQAGVEALSDHLLHLMNKGTTCVQNIYFLKNCVESGMHILWNLISGIPGETEEDYQIYLSLLPKLYHLPPPSGIWSISYQRGAEYYHNQQKYEIQLIPKTTMNQFLYPFSKSSLQNITYFYDDVNVHRLFTIKKIKLIQKISNLIDEWKKKWLENKTPYLLVRQNTIYDFRGDTEIQTELTEGETNLLNYLSEPRQEELLSFVKATTLQNMMDRGWIVKQSGYYLSLVNRKKFLYKAFIPETFQSLVQ